MADQPDNSEQRILEAIRGLREMFNEKIAELGIKTDSNAKAIEEVRGRIDDIERDGVKVDL